MGLDVRRLAGDEAHDFPAFKSLVPELDVAVLPAPSLSVKATRLGGGGLAAGVSVHHVAADAHALFRFLDAWASVSREGSAASLAPPRYGGEAVMHPRGSGGEFARKMLWMVAPNLPVVKMARPDFNQRFLHARRTFYLAADDIRSLKSRISGEVPSSCKKKKPAVSTFVAVPALCWTAFVRRKGLVAGDDTHLMFPANLRARLDPALGDDHLGSFVNGCTASTDAGDFAAVAAGDAWLLHAAQAIQAGDLVLITLTGYNGPAQESSHSSSLVCKPVRHPAVALLIRWREIHPHVIVSRHHSP